MYIQEKYLLKPETLNGANGTGVSSDESITILKCKYCGREFLVPNDEISNVSILDVCESAPCRTSYEKQHLAAKLEEVKTSSPEADEIKRALGN